MKRAKPNPFVIDPNLVAAVKNNSGFCLQYKGKVGRHLKRPRSTRYEGLCSNAATQEIALADKDSFVASLEAELPAIKPALQSPRPTARPDPPVFSVEPRENRNPTREEQRVKKAKREQQAASKRYASYLGEKREREQHMVDLQAVFSCQRKPETLIARTEDNPDGVDLSWSANTRVIIQSLAVYHYYELINAA